MKKIFYFILISGICVMHFTSCKKMDDVYKGFIVEGGLIYPGKANNPVSHSGNKRVKISWQMGADPNVSFARVFWNNYTDSVNVDIAQHSQGDTVSVTIDDLAEGPYSFFIKTYDDKGNVSVPEEVIAHVYGDKYQENLLARPVNSIILYLNDSISIDWGAADISRGAFATEIAYTDTMGGKKVKRIPAAKPATGISDMIIDSGFYYRTLFLPDSLSIDTFYTAFKPYDQNIFIDKSGWDVVAFSSQEGGKKNRAPNIIDGNPATRWTSSTSGQLPQFVTVDMKAKRTIASFEIFRFTGDDRAVDTFQLSVSTDGVQWIDLGVFNFDRFIDEGQSFDIPSHPKARYWRFTGLSAPHDYLLMGEINVYGYLR